MSISYIPDENANKKLTPFKRFVLESFPWIDANFDAMTNYELMGKVVEYLNKTIESQNNVLDNFESIYNYFNTLDVQEEINNKIDEMVEDGSFSRIISNYLDDYLAIYQTLLNNEQSQRIQSDNDLQSQISGLASGSPLVATSTSGMTETDRIYVNTTNGHWYYYNGTAWTDGGTYQSSGIADGSVVWDDFSDDLKKVIKNGTWYNTIKTTGGRFPNKEFTGPFNINDEFLFYPISYGGQYLSTIDIYGLDSNNTIVFSKYNLSKTNETIVKLTVDNVAKIRVTYALSTAENNTVGEFLFSNLEEGSLVNYIYDKVKSTDETNKYVNFYNDSYSQSFTHSSNHNSLVPIKIQKDYTYKVTITGTSDNTNITFDIYGNAYPSAPYGQIKMNESKIFTAYENADNMNVWASGITESTTFTIKIEPYSIPKLQNDINRVSQLNKTTSKIFKKVVCCGDSYTSGHIVDSNNVAHPTNEDYAFPHYMATLTGNEWINCGSSGASSKTWLTSSRGLAKAISSGKSQAYIVGLMINDQSNSDRHVNVGTQADIGTNADSYYGYYSKIIRELNAISPDAKIFIETCPNSASSYVLYNQAVRDIYEAYKDTYPVHLLDLYAYKDLYNNVTLTNDLVGGHYTALGYEQFAEILNYILSNYINDNIDDFQDVAFIEYD